MDNTEAIITLSIKEAARNDKRVFLFHVQLGAEVIEASQSLSVEDSQAVREISKEYNALFERQCAPGLISDDLKVLGGHLFNIWFARAWRAIAAKVQPGSRRVLVIASEVPEILNLPWELISPVGGNFIGLDPKFTVRRLPKKDSVLASARTSLPRRPLRILFMACAPREEAQLEFEREEEAIIRAIAKAGPNVAFDSGDAGSFDELLERINEFQPHIVHLTGHGVVAHDGLGYFAFEDERGQTDLRSSVEMRDRLFSGSSVQLAFISGCQTGKAPPIAAMGGICQGLVGEEIPMAIGWAASIADDIATQFAAMFYRTLAAGQPVDRALTQARQAIQKTCDDRGYPGWTLPVLYSSTTQAMVFDPDPQRAPVPPPRSSVVQHPLEGMSEGYAEHFVGRRREIQRLLPALREGTLHTLLLTGLGGAGKSTLATRLARKLEAFSFKPIAVSSTKEVPLSVARLLQACGDAFLKADLRKAFDTINDPSVAVDARLRFIVSTLNDHRFLLVLDNFEVNLDETTRRILDSEIAGFYSHLLSSLVGQSRAIITCRYVPADANLPATAREEALADFPESSFTKFMLRDAELERKFYASELPRELLTELHRLLGGTPRFLGQMREALKTMTADELRAELRKVKLPTSAEQGVLQRERDKYCEGIFTVRLYGYLSPKSQRALSHAAIYNIPSNPEGLAAVSRESLEVVVGFLREWQNYALAYADTQRGAGDLWSVYGVLRGWLTSSPRLTAEERRAAHRTAGDFLRKIVDNKQESSLGMNRIACLKEARAHYIDASEFDLARDATISISDFLVRQGLYKDLESINCDMLDYEDHPAPMQWIGDAYWARGDNYMALEWYRRCLTTAGENSLEAAAAMRSLGMMDLYHGNYGAAHDKLQKALAVSQQLGDLAGQAAASHELGTIFLRGGDYDNARDRLRRALTMRQKIGDQMGEAASWHQLASIDVIANDYPAAREKLQKALTIRQMVGERAGEASAFYQLGVVAARSGRLAEGMRLIGLCFLIDQSIGHGDTFHDRQMLFRMATQLNYTQGQVDSMLLEASEAYKGDRGWGLIQAAFAKD